MTDADQWQAIANIREDIGGLKQSIDSLSAKIDLLPCRTDKCAQPKNNNWRKYILIGTGIGLVLIGGVPGMEKTIQILAMLLKGS